MASASNERTAEAAALDRSVATTPAPPFAATRDDDVPLGPSRAPTPPLGPAPPATHWQPHWPRFHWAEAVVGIAAEATAVAVFLAEPRRTAGWTQPLPGDPELRLAQRLRVRTDRETVQQVSDALLYVFLGWPILVDAVLLAGVVHGDTDMMVQMTLINAETQAISYLVATLTSRLVGRQRPTVYECGIDPTSSAGCEDTGVGPIASFVSGHAITAFTSAGLVCANHIHNPWLTGSQDGAVAMCGSALALATATGAMRLMSDLHWTSDVAIGAVVGSLIGWAIPLMHYQPARPRRARPAPEQAGTGAFWVVTPQLSSDSLGARAVGLF